MNTLIVNLTNIFNSLIENPKNDYKIAELLKSTLNNTFNGKYICNNVFISKGNDVNPYVINVIPSKSKNINILKEHNINSYDLDIDMSYLMGNKCKSFDAHEITAWLIHELAANIFTDTTFIRYKKLIIHYYDINNINILNTVDILGKLLWIGIFGRTKKDFSETKTKVNNILEEYGVEKFWDIALTKYIDKMGGGFDIISDSYIDRMDKIQLVQFNKLARSYSTYTIKYNNKDYETMIKYIIASTNSKLVEHYCKAEPEQMITFKEKDEFKIFNDSKILLESIDNDYTISHYSDIDLLKYFDDLKLDIANIDNISDKLLISVKLKDFINELNNRIKENNSELFSNVREEAIQLIPKLDDNINYDIV